MPSTPGTMLDDIFDLRRRAVSIWKRLSALGTVQMQYGQQNITPSGANTPTKATITFDPPFPAGSQPNMQVTAVTTAPGTGVTGVAVAAVSDTTADIWLTRTSVITTTIYWFAYV